MGNQRAHLTRYMMHKGRLWNKVVSMNDPEQEENDIMGDVKFGNRKTAKARKDLLQDLADEHVTVDHDGVLGGTNDAEFGGSRRFGRMHSEKKEKKERKKA